MNTIIMKRKNNHKSYIKFTLNDNGLYNQEIMEYHKRELVGTVIYDMTLAEVNKTLINLARLGYRLK